MTDSTLYHVHFTSGGDHDFGSIAAIYEQFTSKDLGVSQNRLYNFGITEEHPYKNKVCMIRKGNIKRKKGKRTVPLLRL